MRTLALFALVGLARGQESPLKAWTDLRQCGYGSYCKCDKDIPTCQYTNAPCLCRRRLQAEGSAVKALADHKQCGFGSYCKCDSADPTCHITNVPCQCFGQDPVSTAVVGAAIIKADALTEVAQNMLNRIRLNNALRSQIQAIQRTQAIKQALRNRIAHRLQALYESQLQREAMMGQVADVVNSFDLVKAIKLKDLMPSVAELGAFKTQLSTDLDALKNAVVLRSTIFQDLNKLAWAAKIREAFSPLSVAVVARQIARAKQMTDAINALAEANQRKQMLKSRMQELVEAFKDLEEAEGDIIEKFQPEEEYGDDESRRRLLLIRSGYVGTPMLRTGFVGSPIVRTGVVAATPYVGHPYGAFATTPAYSTLGFARPGVVRCYGGFCNRYLW